MRGVGAARRRGGLSRGPGSPPGTVRLALALGLFLTFTPGCHEGESAAVPGGEGGTAVSSGGESAAVAGGGGGAAAAGGGESEAVDRGEAGAPGTEGAGGAPAVVMDAAGRTHRLQTPAARIVSLVPSATAVLMSMGAGDRLVGRTDFDTASALADLPSVGGGLQPDLERLVSLEPELVIRFAGPSDMGTVESLDRMHIPSFAVRPDRIADVRTMIGQLGTLTGEEGAADSLLGVIDGQLDQVRRTVAAEPPVRTAYLLGGTPPWVAGPGSFIDELIQLAGGINVFSDLAELYGPVSLEELIRREVDVYLTSRGTELAPETLRAAPIRTLGPAVELPGPMLGEAAREVARALHPGAFP